MSIRNNPAVHAHFLDAAEIWRAFFAGKIGSTARENALRPLRAALAKLK